MDRTLVVKDHEYAIAYLTPCCMEEADFAEECIPYRSLTVNGGGNKNDTMVDLSDLGELYPRSLTDL